MIEKRNFLVTRPRARYFSSSVEAKKYFGYGTGQYVPGVVLVRVRCVICGMPFLFDMERVRLVYDTIEKTVTMNFLDSPDREYHLVWKIGNEYEFRRSGIDVILRLLFL
jgi:hypothetical protein